MSEQVGIPDNRFSHDEAHIFDVICCRRYGRMKIIERSKTWTTNYRNLKVGCRNVITETYRTKVLKPQVFDDFMEN